MFDIKIECLYHKNQKFKIDNFKQKYKIKDITVSFNSPSIDLLERYRYYLLANSEYKKMKSEYFMRPDYVSIDEYGTSTLDFIIMYLNNCFTPEDFTMSNAYIPDKSTIIKIVQDNMSNNEFDVKIISFDDTDLTSIQNKLLIEAVGKLVSDYFKTAENYFEFAYEGN